MPTPEMNSKPEAPASKPTEAAKPVTPKLGKAPAAAPVITVENTYALAYQTLKQTLQQFIRLKVPAVAALRLDAENCFETLRVALEQPDTPENRALVAQIAREILVDVAPEADVRERPRPFTIAPDGKSITCLRCGRTSYNLNDVRHLYCGHCHQFHQFA